MAEKIGKNRRGLSGPSPRLLDHLACTNRYITLLSSCFLSGAAVSAKVGHPDQHQFIVGL
ncbi:hypothetical protein TcasGA2_TC015752 [Tribolium castaneum]|uniref:Uncharacterized protein n=1 Tax=Tribolium castaneum TaxID=7070 RepID=D2A3T1_TRICA|nr:hypothetical protein TcasGA2_TC015752 [Tribolium castaneum]